MANPETSVAIQVLSSRDELISGELKRKIKIVQNRRGYTLENILCSKDVKDLQILVFSIVGKTRGGKSLLLNLMIKYLESQSETEDWLSGIISHEHGFTWKGGLDSVTRGIWIWPKIYRRKTNNGTEVGILLVDNEGMFDGEATDGEIIALCGISTAMSYIQMFNVKDKITTDYLETVERNLVKGIENMDSDQSAKLRDDYNLMFVVRDWVYEEDHSFGLEGGKTYIERDSERGSRELKNLWSEIKRTFSDLQCLLLPFPGSAVEKEFAKTGDLNELDKEFLKQVKSFITNIFAPKNLVPPKTKLTGEGVYRLLMSVDGKIADDNLSFLNMFTENINFYKESQLLARFPGGFQDLDLLQKLKTEIETEGENAFRGQSKTRFNERLKRTLEQMMNSEVIQKVYKKYEDNFSSSKRTKQCHEIWKGCVSLLDKYMCGNTATRIQTREKAVQKMSDVYYRQLYEEVYNDFKDSIKDLKELEELTGLDDKTVKERFLKLDDFTDIVDTNVIHPIWLKYHQNLKCCVTEHFLKKIEELTGAENLENVRAEQYKFYEACTLLKKNGDIWDSIPGDKTLLFKKVGYALFGPPKQVIHTEIRPTQTDTNKNCTVATGYNSDQDKKIISIVNAILSCTDKEIKFSYVYVTYQEDSIDTSIPEEEKNQNVSSIPEEENKKISSIPEEEENKNISSIPEEEENKKNSSIPEEEENKNISSIPKEEENQKVSSIPAKKKIKNIPVFKTQSGGSNIVYIDTNCRVYESWADFLTTNTLPDIVICYPLHGSYDIKTGFSVGFFKTPASSAKSKVLKAADKVEKVISVGAGVAGVAALVVAAPVLAPCAVVGGAAAGIYGFGRCVVKILDKKKHNEPYAKEVVKGAFNVIAVAAAGALRVAEGAVVVSTKIAQGICGLNGFVGLLYSDNMTKLIELLDELCDQSSMISFYFNAASTSEAIENIRKALKINEDSDDVEVLLALVNVNSIQYSVDKGDVINIEKYVSENVTELVFKLLNTISTAEKDILILLAEINQYAQFLTEETSKDVYNKIDSNMSKLYGNLQKENEKYSSAYNQLISNGNEEDKHHILLILRYLMCSVSSRVREVNQYCNNIEHRPVCLMSYNVRCHPLEEVNRKIKDKIEQNKSFTDSSSELDDFLPQILDFLPRNATLNWNLTQYAQCLLSITDGMMKMFDEEIKQLKTKVPKKNPTCNDLNDIFEEIGIKGNYGKELFERVLQEYQVDQLQQVDSDPKGLTCVQAWYGMADNLNCYYSSCCDDPEELFDKLFPKKYNRDNFEERKVTENLTYWEPCVSNLPGYFVYSLSDKKQGLTYLIPSETDCKVSVKEPRQNGRMGELCASPN